tara:strand:- start:232 stop:750 length:519 start_codon:yes stop_codon:yes gene_type:complete
MQPTLNCDPNVAHTTQMVPLGAKHTKPSANRTGTNAADPDMDTGPLELVYVFNDSGATIDAGDVCLRKAAEERYHVLVAPAALAPAMRTVGVALFEIEDDEYGFIAYKGIVPVKHEAGTTVANLSIVHGATTAGCIDAMGAGEEENVIGLGISNNAGVAEVLVDTYINCPGA